jgi:uncharacterized protein (DUF1800 family)
MKLTDRDKIAHLYRRFSFGGTVAEIDEGVANGLEATLKKLIDYDTVPSAFNIHPFEFAWKEKEEAEVGIWKFRLWWLLSMLVTKRPLQEKLSIFWHSHFAVSDAKVENACLMLEYLQAIRKNANGKFGLLLKDMAKSPAMMRYLDMERAFKGHPNENFAREVMELFTMGLDKYSEQDIREVSRALTGWGFIDTFWEGGSDNTKRLMTIYRDKRPAGAFCLMPHMRDAEPKTILGTTKDFDGDAVLDFLAIRPETAQFISKKLWEFFAYPDPEQAIVDRLAAVFTKTGGDVKQVLFAIGRSPEFYGETCVLRHYKNPVDYVVGQARQMGVGEALVAMRPKEATPLTPIKQEIVDNVGYMMYHITRMGLDLCYPADVSGWKFGKDFITPSAMTYRMQFHGLMIWDSKGPSHSTKFTQNKMLSKSPQTPADCLQRFTEIFDLNLGADAKKSLTEYFEKQGVDCYKNPDQWAGTLYTCLKMLSGCPDYHVC